MGTEPLVAQICPVCLATVEALGKAWKCRATSPHYFGLYQICGECGYSTMYIGHGPGCTQRDGGDHEA